MLLEVYTSVLLLRTVFLGSCWSVVCHNIKKAGKLYFSIGAPDDEVGHKRFLKEHASTILFIHQQLLLEKKINRL